MTTRPLKSPSLSLCRWLGATVVVWMMLLVCMPGEVNATDSFADKPIGLSARSTGAEAERSPASTGPSVGRVVFSLAAVAGLIVLLGLGYRRLFGLKRQGSGGPVTLVGRSLLTPRHQVLVLRVGNRLVVVGDSGQGMNRLCEITDPAEVSAVLGDAGAAGDPELAELRRQAFGAALDGAAEEFDGIPGGEVEGREAPPQPLDGARDEVRSLIERVRSLAGQMTSPDDRTAR